MDFLEVDSSFENNPDVGHVEIQEEDYPGEGRKLGLPICFWATKMINEKRNIRLLKYHFLWLRRSLLHGLAVGALAILAVFNRAALSLGRRTLDCLALKMLT